ncbi:MAG: tetraacyldisaccharide 4'-kinase [Henriciella sp.]
MREPRFWSREVDPKSREAAPLLRFLLSPLAALYTGVTRRKIKTATPTKVEVIVICVGNLTAGGVGKSPVVSALRHQINAEYGLRAATLSRGYKGRLKGPLRVSPDTHSAADVGDEPLMLAQGGEAWIGADRAAAGLAMAQSGVDVIIMDDGHQNPGLHKDLSLVVVDSKAGFGNGFVIPKGPLREHVADGLSRADAIVLMGDDTPPAALNQTSLPLIKGRIEPTEQPASGKYVAFAGIGRPEKFFDTLNALGVEVCDAVPFPDHHAYTSADLNYLRRLADDHQATLITTEKDLTRLSGDPADGIISLPIRVQFEPKDLLDKLLADVIKPSTNG